jgi:hypothetical protein
LLRDADHWQARLPLTLLTQVVWPVRMQSFHDDGVPASKWRGYDALGLLCYYRYVYSRWSTDFCDTSGAAPELLQQEEMEAWRTLLGTWVRRSQSLRPSDPPDPAQPLVVESGFELVTARSIPRL